MGKMMMIVTAVFSLAACGVESPEETERLCAETDEACDFEVPEEEPTTPKPHVIDDPDVTKNIEPFVPQLCYWHSECPSHVCDLETRTCRDYPF